MLFVRKKLNRISRTVNLELLEISSLKKRMQGDVSGIDPDDIDAVIIEGKKMSKEEYFKNKNALKEIEELRKKCVGWWDI